MRKINEECGVFGICGSVSTDVASDCYLGLFALQHRGQESCGIVVNDDGVFHTHKDEGLVGDVFTPEILAKLGNGTMAIAHCRYGNAATRGRVNAQPMVVNHVKGRMALAFNGSLVNAYELREELELGGAIFHTASDTEVISYIITQERLKATSIEEAVTRAMTRLKGAYSIVIMSPAKMIAVRDPHGIRPLCYGRRPDGTYIVASESCALDAAGASLIRDVKPGEVLVFSGNSVRSIDEHCDKVKSSLCIFEYIYFARPDSVVDGTSVHASRVKAGELLAEEYPIDADIVIGVPDSGLDAAIGYSRRSGIPYGIGFLKNKYIGRTFIAPVQSTRQMGVKIKLNPIADAVKGKRVVLIDDSIVRGTTSERIVRLLREAGAKEIHLRLSSPKFLNPCFYGTDVGSRKDLIACHHSVEEISRIIGTDSLGFLSTDALKHIVNDPNMTFCSACFDGNYPTEVPDTDEPRQDRYDQKINKKGD